jgi:hypothetical protein
VISGSRGHTLMRMVKQKGGSNECGVCAVAMLVDRSREEILKDVPKPEQPDHFWLNYMVSLGFSAEDVRNDRDFDRSLVFDGKIFKGQLHPPLGYRYYCSVCTAKGVHAVAIDERGMVFDPSTSAPMSGTCTFAEYLEANRTQGIVRVGCYRVRRQGS